MPDSERDLFRHVIAAAAYRASKALRGAPESFADFKASESTRTPLQILAHMGDLYDWALTIVKGQTQWRDSEPLPWPEECERFFRSVTTLDAYLASDAPLHGSVGKVLQAGIADSLTHIGQIAMLRRIAGCPVRGENYYLADIRPGRTGFEQAAAVREFD
jgi:hypothetical protein